MRRIAAFVLLGLFLSYAPARAQDATPPPATAHAASAQKNWLKLVGGGLAMSVGLVLIQAGNTPDPFTGDKSGGQMLAGAGLAGGGAWLLWSGWKGTFDPKPRPSVGVFIRPKAAGIAFQHRW